MNSLRVLFAFLLISFVLGSPFTRQQFRDRLRAQKAGVFIEDLQCKLDPKLTVENLLNSTDLRDQIHRYLWADACPKSRGVFTLDGSFSGETYSCATWPKEWGINNPGDFFKDPSQYEEHLKYLEMYLWGVYNTTAVKGPNACDFKSFSMLQCGEDRFEPWRTAPWVEMLGNKPIRGVNMGGLFLLEPWINPGFTNWVAGEDDEYTYSQANPKGSVGAVLLEGHWETFYSNDDFVKMNKYGLNAGRLPVGWWFFADDAGIDHSPYLVPTADLYNSSHPLTQVILGANKNNIAILLDLHGAPGSQNGLDNSGRRSDNPNAEEWGYTWAYDQQAQDDHIKILKSMTKYIVWLQNELGADKIMGIELMNEPWVFLDMSIVRDFYVRAIPEVRQIAPNLPIIVSDAFRHAEWAWLLNDWPYVNTFMDTHIYHAFNPDDIASSTPSCDKLKITIAENIACGYGSMLRYKTCTSLPVFVGEWSLATDDCMGNIRGQDYSVQFHDFGQCKHLQERIGDPFWVEHLNSFASRQMEMAERELGQFFWTWKTGPKAKSDPSNGYWSFVDAVDMGYITVPLSDSWIKGSCDMIVDDGGKC
eukprot:TRINITY_DN10927_c0_g1_i1.p1 TRINITY_DN10927_c0_g1~~TRINITY_DN10927_c0_g1_i1.p1  ORF type:complete len:589 (-),score=108.55 TRINITY_DN10927_c0_g1_i1:36-1802(-)